MYDWIHCFMFFTRFLLFTFIRWWPNQAWNKTELEWNGELVGKKINAIFPSCTCYSPPIRKCPDIPVLPSHSFPPDLSFWEKVHAYGCKSSTLEAVVTSVSFLSRQNRQRRDHIFDRQWIISIYLGIKKSQNWETLSILITDIHVISFYRRAST